MAEVEKYFDLTDIKGQFPEKITRLTCDGDIYYLKRRFTDRLLRRKLMRFVQRLLVKALRLKVLTPTVNVRLSSSYEPKKILKLAELGINVPRVVYFNDDYFIMSDCGETLKSFVTHHPDQADTYLQGAIRQLAELHNCGHAHGGAQIRNFAVKDGRICLFDFEEIVPEKYCEEVQFRDILIFLVSLSRSKGVQVDYRGLLDAYEEAAQVKGNTQKIVRLAQRFRWLAGLSSSRYATVLGKDVYYLSLLVSHLLKLPEACDTSLLS